jgi:hypothetical protein
MKQEIINYIRENGLDTKSRAREYSYRRMFLFSLLHKQGLTLQAIADIFHRTHATIIHGIRTDAHFIKTNDEIYKLHIQKELELFYQDTNTESLLCMGSIVIGHLSSFVINSLIFLYFALISEKEG